jgi:cobalt-zinc-cadmium efflux system membrane fusion protein
VEVRAPIAGTILERNVAPRDIVDTTANLFLVADLTQLRIWAEAPEGDLPVLQTLPSPIPWTVRLKSDPGAGEMPGAVDKVGTMVDPDHHTVRIMGHVRNQDGRLRPGQLITATIVLPASPDEVAIPAAALVEQGGESFVFVQPDPRVFTFAQRRVAVVRKGRDVVHLRFTAKPQGGHSEAESLRPGDRVVIAGAVELKAALDQRKAGGKP